MVARVSIRDVAREAGVSVTTVSHALNGKGRLNPETRERVREVADRLGYRPNPAARSLVSGRTGLIAAVPSLPAGLEMEFTEFAYFSELIAAATGVAVGRDNALVVSPPAADWFVWDRVPLDGVIVIEPVAGEPALPDLRRRGLPFVTVSADPAGSARDAVVRSDDIGGVTRMLDHLVDAGGSSVAMLAPPPFNRFASDCVEAYRRWSASAGRPSLLDVLDEGTLIANPDGAYLAGLDRILARRPRPDALFVPIELAGVSALEQLKNRGLRVPDDILLATTRDAGRVTTTEPPVTTLEWNYPEIGRRAAQMLLDLIDGARAAPCDEVIETTVVPRASTAR
ncbi:MAG TPA: LacI family DNA-binding transcriptional regulator [Actinomycetota bacterium]|jgi:DNA-binding LacI/PurR family transcriptional regulator|nr:LacI family DNA-binding transcriptional regulator [Actinomycetota bacterium]